MSRRVPALLVASIGVGVLLAGLAASHVAAQTPRVPDGMRATIDAEADEARARRSRPQAPPKPRDTTPIGQIPRFGTPPAAGAGKTGFVSILTPRRKSTAGKDPLKRAGQPKDTPLPLSSFGTSVTADAAASSKSPPPAAKGAKRAKVEAKAATRPKAPAAVAREQAKDQLNTLPNTVVPVRRGAIEDDPYGALGVRAGAFVARPAVETSAGYDSNPGRVSGGRGSAFVTVAPELVLRSDWQRHELAADVRGSYTAYEATPELDRPTLDSKVTGRIDVTERTHADLEGRYRLATDRPGSPDLQVGLAKLPLYADVGTTAGVTQRFNRFEIALKGSFDRFTWDDSELTDGRIVPNTDRNFDQYAGVARASYEFTPAFKPFAEFGADARIHDLVADRSGVRRDSDGIYFKAGTSFEIARTLVGEVGLGYLTRTYDDLTLPHLQGVLFDASLLWAASGLTNVKFTTRTTAADTTLPGVAGVFRREASLQVEHAFRRWLIGVAGLSYRHDDYQGSTREDQFYAASAGIVYKLTRSLQVKGEFRQEWLKSNVPGNDYTASIAMVGLRWQP